MMNIKSVFMFFFLSLMLSLLMINLSLILSEKEPYLSKLSIYECGFTPFHKPNNPFSMSFFLMGMLFLMFDLEMVLLFPWSPQSKNLGLYPQMVILMFMTLLIMGLWYEWIKGGLEWE